MDSSINGEHTNGIHINGDQSNSSHANGDHMNVDHHNDSHMNGDRMNDGHVNGNHMNGDHTNVSQVNGNHPNGDQTMDDLDDFGDDSGIGSLDVDDTMSLSSEVTRYRVENYRRYHAFDEEKYFQPNDAQAQDHEALFHRLCLKTFNNALFLAPLGRNIQKVLDVGTGTGLWAEAFADRFPSAQILGTDLSPIQTTWPVANYKFEVDDAEQDWTFPENSFDYIHIRGLLGCVQNWPKLYAQCYRCLKPGGYLEHLEIAPYCTLEDGIELDESMQCWLDNTWLAFGRIERDILIYMKMALFMRDEGFEGVVDRPHQWPVGPWPADATLKDEGELALEYLTTGLEGWAMRPLTQYLGWSFTEATVACANVRRELRNPDLHLLHDMSVVYGRKPHGPVGASTGSEGADHFEYSPENLSEAA